MQTAAAVERDPGQARARASREGLQCKVVYDSTTFVTDTIHEVLKTLGEAFVLVVIVVFLFLGNLRATIIPAVAVPVSLIGTFAVLLAIGYSANTVSLLAMVLAIGIVVDDAIVVVENVERVMEEEPGARRRGDAIKKAMRQITAPIIAITLVLLSVFVPIAFIPGISGAAVPPVRGDDQRRDADLGHQRADPVAGALRACSCATTGKKRGIMARVLRGIDHVRDGYARDRDAGSCASASSRRSLVIVGFAVGDLSRLRCRTPTGFLPEEDQGAFFVAVQLPDGASVARTSAVVRAGREAAARRCRRSQDTFAVIGFSLLDSASTSPTPPSWWSS